MKLKDTNEMFADDLRDPAYAAGYLNIALEDDGIEGFLYALQKVARAHGISKVASSSDMPRESLYRSLSNKGNPGIRPLGRVMEALGLRLTITPAATTSSPSRTEEDNASVEPQPATLALESIVGEEIDALCREARAAQEAMRRATQEIQEEARHGFAQLQQLTAVMAEQIQAGTGARRTETRLNH